MNLGAKLAYPVRCGGRIAEFTIKTTRCAVHCRLAPVL